MPGVPSRCPPGTESLQKRFRCPIPLPTWHGIPAKDLARNPCKSVSGVPSRCPPGTESLQKRFRCLFPPSTWHGNPAKVFQVALLCCPPDTAVPLIMGCRGFSAGHVDVFSMERVAVSTPAVSKPPCRCLQGTFVTAGVPSDVTPGNDSAV